MPDSTLYNILNSAGDGSPAEKDAALVDAIAHMQPPPLPGTSRQLMYRGGGDEGVLHLLPAYFRECEQAAPFLSLVIERGRESCGTTALMSLTDTDGDTPLHCFAYFTSDLSLTKMVLREHPPSLAVLNNDGRTPLHHAGIFRGSTSERVVFFRAATAAYTDSNFVDFERICGGSSPYLARELGKQATALRVAVNICLKRQEEAPSVLSSPETGVALALLSLVRDFGRDRHSSDLLRRVLEYVGPYATSCDEN